MDCAGIAEHLIGYHVGALDDEALETVEAHLVGCGACLATYLALKRASDRAEVEQPSPDLHARLRDEVGRAFPGPVFAPERGFTRRIRLWKAVALAAVAASVALAAPRVFEHLTEPRVSAGLPTIDTARTRAESFHIY